MLAKVVILLCSPNSNAQLLLCFTFSLPFGIVRIFHINDLIIGFNSLANSLLFSKYKILYTISDVFVSPLCSTSINVDLCDDLYLDINAANALRMGS